MGTVNQEAQLARIADALESIDKNLDGICSALTDMSTSLESLDNSFSSCVAPNGRSKFFHIAGSVYTN